MKVNPSVSMKKSRQQPAARHSRALGHRAMGAASKKRKRRQSRHARAVHVRKSKKRKAACASVGKQSRRDREGERVAREGRVS